MPGAQREFSCLTAQFKRFLSDDVLMAVRNAGSPAGGAEPALACGSPSAGCPLCRVGPPVLGSCDQHGAGAPAAAPPAQRRWGRALSAN